MRRHIALCFGLLVICQSIAGEARFFRLVGPAATTITAIAPDGTVTWTNAQTDVICTVQTSTNLLSGWVDYIQVPISNAVMSQRLFDLAPPVGMVFIPASSFTMDDTFNEGYTVERPTHTVYVSAFYMDRYEVTKALWDEVKA